ncbi:MAG: ABC transporter permease [Acetobacteraceae bacterium]|nr:ABC transporter permease [Acetobacteraceae bacterium]
METAIETAPAKPPQRARVPLLLAKYGTLLGLALMLAVFSVLAPVAFPTVSNLINVLNQASLALIIAGGLTVAVIVGELDLSIGFAASFEGVLVTGLMVNQGLPVWLAILAVLACGALIGVINGLIVTKIGVNSVIATLGTGTIVVGLNFAYSSGAPIAEGVPEAFTDIAIGRLGGIPHDVLIMAAVIALLWVLVERSTVGQSIQAVGGNPIAARLSGIRVEQIKILGFVVAGVCAALTGILLASALGSGTTSAADSYLLTAFAAVFLGSATLRDGEFHILGTLIGGLIIAVGFNGLAIFGAPTFYQYVFQGAILILAVGLSSLGRRYARR